MSTERWIHDSIHEDTPEFAVFGPDTWGLVDEDQGGVVAYFHENNAPMFAHLVEGTTLTVHDIDIDRRGEVTMITLAPEHGEPMSIRLNNRAELLHLIARLANA